MAPENTPFPTLALCATILPIISLVVNIGSLFYKPNQLNPFRRTFFKCFAFSNIFMTVTITPMLIATIGTGTPFWKLFGSDSLNWCKLQAFLFCFHKDLCIVILACFGIAYDPHGHLGADPSSHWGSCHPFNVFIPGGISLLAATIECQFFAYVNAVRQCVFTAEIYDLAFGLTAAHAFLSSMLIMFFLEKLDSWWKTGVVLLCTFPWYNFGYKGIIWTPANVDTTIAYGPIVMLFGHLSTFLTTVGWVEAPKLLILPPSSILLISQLFCVDIQRPILISTSLLSNTNNSLLLAQGSLCRRKSSNFRLPCNDLLINGFHRFGSSRPTGSCAHCGNAVITLNGVQNIPFILYRVLISPFVSFIHLCSVPRVSYLEEKRR
uniref:G_PROTEIN_RECEP_F1_2 domain-containing protein n=1 Tax=Steinernema glaseri TaxID=37863 RepID=A0A1I7Z603_9BILA